jgi:hypothetical protein
MYNEYEMQVIPETQLDTCPHMLFGTNSNGKIYLGVKKPQDQVIDARYLKMQLEINREQDLLEYFKEMN